MEKARYKLPGIQQNRVVPACSSGDTGLYTKGEDSCCETVAGCEHHREEGLSAALPNVTLSLVSYTEGKTMGALSCRAINSCDRISMASRAQCLDPSSEGYLGGGDKPRKAGMGALGEKNQKPSPGPSLVEHSSWPETG